MPAAVRTTTHLTRRAVGLAIATAGAGLWVAQATEWIRTLNR